MGALSGKIATQTALNKIQYKQKFLEVAKENNALKDIMEQVKMGAAKNKGDVIEVTQFLPIAAVTSALTEGASGTATDFVTQKKQFTLDEWGAYVEYSSHYKWATWDQGDEQLHARLGEQAANSMERKFAQEWATHGAIGMRADADGTYEQHDVAVSDTSTTTSIVAGALVGADDLWNGARITITEGPGYGQSAQVTDWVLATTTLTVGAGLTTTPTTDTKFSITTTTGLAAGDVISGTNIKRAVRELMRKKFRGFKGKGASNGFGFAAMVIDPDTHYDLMKDSALTALLKDHSSSPKGIFDNSIGQVWGADISLSTFSFREAVEDGTPLAGVYAAAGAVHCVPLFGREAMCAIEADGASMRVIYGDPKQYDPALQMKGTVGWKTMEIPAIKNAAWSVNLLCGATA